MRSGQQRPHHTGSPPSLSLISFLPHTPRHVHPREQKHTHAHAAGTCTEHTLSCKSHVHVARRVELTCQAVTRLSDLESMAAPPVGKIFWVHNVAPAGTSLGGKQLSIRTCQRREQNSNEMFKAVLQEARKNDLGHAEMLNF